MVAAATRLIPYEMVNFTAIGALAFMGGAMIENKWLRYILPIGLLAITDLVLNTVVHSEFTGGSFFYEGMLWVYIPFILSVALGRIILKEASALAKLTSTFSKPFFSKKRFTPNAQLVQVIPSIPTLSCLDSLIL